MVVGSAISDWGMPMPANSFMVHAATAMEDYDATATANSMVQADWRNYPAWLYASKWHELFPANDGRRALTWKDRLSTVVGPQVYNFYSSGENVLKNLTAGYPSFGVLIHIYWRHEYAWCIQELWKGRYPAGLGGSLYGGWGFNLADYGEPVLQPDGSSSTKPWSPTHAATISPNDLRTKPFFVKGDTWLNPLYQEPNNPSGVGSTFSTNYTIRSRLLAEMIPALSFATGANSVSSLIDPVAGDRNFDMNALYKTGWPAERNGHDWSRNRWLHGDYRAVAYVYVYRLFDDIQGKMNP
jgi:hypothetical protein